MKRTIKPLATGLGLSLLALTGASQNGYAFDSVNWQWDAAVEETVRKTVTIEALLQPAGLVFIEDHQIQIGDVDSVSQVSGIHNNKPSTVITRTVTETTSEFQMVDVDFDALLQVGAGNNGGANPQGAANYNSSGLFTDPSLPGAQSHLALFLLANFPDGIDFTKSFADESNKTFEIYAYFDALDMYLEIKGSYAGCTPGGANCTPTGTVELYRLDDDDQKIFVANTTLNQQNGVDQVNTAGPGGDVKLSADFDGAQQLEEIISEITTEENISIPLVTDALTDLPSVVSAATTVANNSSVNADAAIQIHETQLSVGGVQSSVSENPDLLVAFLDGHLGSLVQGGLNSLSTVDDILNASVDSSATTVANNKWITIAHSVPDNAVLIGDVVQGSYNDVTATSMVSNVTLQSYVNLGLIDRPIVSSASVAVANNKGITVATPNF